MKWTKAEEILNAANEAYEGSKSNECQLQVMAVMTHTIPFSDVQVQVGVIGGHNANRHTATFDVLYPSGSEGGDVFTMPVIEAVTRCREHFEKWKSGEEENPLPWDDATYDEETTKEAANTETETADAQAPTPA